MTLRIGRKFHSAGVMDKCTTRVNTSERVFLNRRSEVRLLSGPPPRKFEFYPLVFFALSAPLLFGWGTFCSRFELAHCRVGGRRCSAGRVTKQYIAEISLANRYLRPACFGFRNR